MLQKKVGVAVLAAGFGQITPDVPKSLERFNHKRLVQYPLDEAIALGSKPVVVVNGGDFGDKIIGALSGDYSDLAFARQSERRGPADAFNQALPLLRAAGCTEAVALFGDMPFVSRYHIRGLVIRHKENKADLTISTWQFNPSHSLAHCMWGYANFCVDRSSEAGATCGFPIIRKYKEYPDNGAEVLSSVYVINLDWFEQAFPDLPEEDKGDGFAREKHLPNLVELAALSGRRVVNMQLSDNDVHEIVGVNTLNDWQELLAFSSSHQHSSGGRS